MLSSLRSLNRLYTHGVMMCYCPTIIRREVRVANSAGRLGVVIRVSGSSGMRPRRPTRIVLGLLAFSPWPTYHAPDHRAAARHQLASRPAQRRHGVRHGLPPAAMPRPVPLAQRSPGAAVTADAQLGTRREGA